MEKLEHFLAKAMPEPNSGCWIWLGSVLQERRRTKPYGRYGSHGEMAHRASWRLHRGSIPEGIMVCHTCDNCYCVNPDHLFLGTARENSDDKVLKNRQASGKKIRPLTLTEDGVKLILSSPNTPLAELGRRLGVSAGVVWGVRNKKSYKWVVL